jgi:hypothetical protein
MIATRRITDRARAVTLVELMVATAALVTVLGLAYGLYDATRDAAIKMNRRQAAVDFAVLAMDEIVELIGRAVRPEDFEAIDRGAATTLFERDRLALTVYDDLEAGLGPYRVEIRPAVEPLGGVTFERRNTPSIGDGAAFAWRPFGTETAQFRPKIAFGYAAAAAEPGREIEYLPRAESQDWPALIQVAIEIELENDLPIRLQTAAIPGRLSMRGGAESPARPLPKPDDPAHRPTPTPKPTETPAAVGALPPPDPILPPIRSPRPTETPTATPPATPIPTPEAGR